MLSTNPPRPWGARTDPATAAHPHSDLPLPGPSRAERTLRRVFVVVYTCFFLLDLDSLVLPAGQRHGPGMVLYVALFLLGVWAWRHELAGQARRIAARKRWAAGVLALGLVAEMVLGTAGGLASQWLAQVVPQGSQALTNDSNIAAVLTVYPAIVIIAVLGVMGPVVEEVVFRQVLIPLIGGLTRPWVGVVVSSVLFGMLHMSSFQVSEWIGIIPHVCFGLVAGTMFVRTGNNLLFPATLHVLTNLSGIVPNA